MNEVLQFMVSDYCHQDSRVCVGVAWQPTEVVVADTKLDDSPQLLVSHREWGWLIRAIKDGRYDTDGQFDINRLPSWSDDTVVRGHVLVIGRDESGNVHFCGLTREGVCVTLTYDGVEMEVFVKGAKAGHFDSADSPGRLPAH